MSIPRNPLDHSPGFFLSIPWDLLERFPEFLLTLPGIFFNVPGDVKIMTFLGIILEIPRNPIEHSPRSPYSPPSVPRFCILGFINSHSRSFRTGCLSVLLFKMLLKGLSCMIRDELQRFVNLK